MATAIESSSVPFSLIRTIASQVQLSSPLGKVLQRVLKSAQAQSGNNNLVILGNTVADGQNSVFVPFPQNQPDTNYFAAVQLTGGTLQSTAVVKDPTGVTVAFGSPTAGGISFDLYVTRP